MSSPRQPKILVSSMFTIKASNPVPRWLRPKTLHRLVSNNTGRYRLAVWHQCQSESTKKNITYRSQRNEKSLFLTSNVVVLMLRHRTYILSCNRKHYDVRRLITKVRHNVSIALGEHDFIEPHGCGSINYVYRKFGKL